MFERPNLVSASFQGVIGDRLSANRRNWLHVAPIANPTMVAMFDHQHSLYLPWPGEFVGKYLISAVQDLRMSRDGLLTSTVAELVGNLINLQDTDGYLGPFDGKDRIFGDNWDVWGHYHCVLGLYEWFRYTGDQAALNACIKATEHLAAALGTPETIRKLFSRTKNYAFAHAAALLYQATQRSSFVDLLHRFESAWGSDDVVGNYVAKLQTPGSLWAAFKAPNESPRWERLHSLQAVGELYRITGSKPYLDAFINAWQGIRMFDRHITGGFTALEAASGNPFDPRPIETCGTVAWMALSVDMLRLTASSDAADELELSTWNAALGAQSPDGRWWTYDTPMGGISTDTGIPVMWPFHPMHRKPTFAGARRPAPYDLAWQPREGAAYLSCCAANGPRSLGVLSEWAVMTAADGIVVNFYGPSRFTVALPTGNQVIIQQTTRYPLEGRVDIVITATHVETFTVRVRIPAWSTTTSVAVNGTPGGPMTPGSYHPIWRTWHPGDTIRLELDMHPRAVAGSKPPADCDPDSGHGAPGRVALYRGPILLAYDERYDQFTVDDLPAMPANPQLTVDQSPPQPGDTRFLRVRAQTRGGQISLGDFASAGMTATWPVQLDNLASLRFQFGRSKEFGNSDGTILAQRIRLLPDGTIDGYQHPNEHSWTLQDGYLVFIHQDGHVTTRFTWYALENGRAVLRGPSGQYVHELRELDLGVVDKLFQFSRTDRTLAPRQLRLLPDGTIQGSGNPNESRWEVQDGYLIFIRDDGHVTTRFINTATKLGRVDYTGPFLDNPTITHQLRLLDPEVTGKVWQFRRDPPPFYPDSNDFFLNPSVWTGVCQQRSEVLGGGPIPGARLWAINIVLHPDGTIDSDHPNETFWALEQQPDGPSLLFMNDNSSITTRFSLDKDSEGRMVWNGTFVDSRYSHYLVEWSSDLTWSDSNSSRYISWLPGPF
ncbi:MAG: beta-L-arabinofuranosidase domain-containing protein [Mycobacterium sp.]